MKVVILAGGLGTRLAEETELRPKPMVEIGGWPILWHILKIFGSQGFREFYIALGYKGDVIKKFFLDLPRITGNLTVDLGSGAVSTEALTQDDWRVHLIETGADSMTGGRIRRLAPYLQGEPFLVTYGDGVANVDLHALLRTHRQQGRLATVTAVRPPARFGGLVLEEDRVERFTEKSQAGEGWINGGFLVLQPEVFQHLHGDADSLEVNLLEQLAAQGQLSAYRHEGFWQCMDTLRDKRQLEAEWASGHAPWKLWK